MNTLSARLARLGQSGPTGAALLSYAQKRAFNEFYEQDPIPPWALFILLVSEYRFVTFYRSRKQGVDAEGWTDWTDDSEELEKHIRWNTVLLGFRTALRRTEVDAFLRLLPVAAGAMEEARGDDEETEEARAIAREAIPPEIRELLRLAVYTAGVSGYVQLWVPLNSAFATRYTQMRKTAYAMVRSWFGAREIEYDENVFGRTDEAEPKPPSPEEDEAPCPDRDRPPGGQAERPCESEEEEFERLGKELLGATNEDIAAVLLELTERRGCGAPKRFCMSRHGEALGVCENQELWQRMCEAMSWTDDPPVLRTVQTTPDRRVYTNGDEPRFVLAIRLSDHNTRVRQLEPEYTVTPGERITLYDWHAYYMTRCMDKP